MKKLALLLVFIAATAVAQPLPRRGTIGLAVAPENDRVVVRMAVPNLPAAAAGFQAGDVLVAVDGQKIAATPEFISRVGAHKAGEAVKIDFVRDGAPRSATVTLTERPRETSAEWDVIYGQVRADGNRYRTITTKPKGDGRFPTLLLVQGVGCASIDNPPPDDSYANVLATLSRAGFATLRVDKPGVGDSEGGPCAAASFQTEVNAYRAALASLTDAPFVDQQKVFLFGHSMGGVMAPLIASAHPLRGIAVYGTLATSWFYYTLENIRRQARLSGDSFEEMSRTERMAERFNARFFVDKWPIDRIVKEYPEYAALYPDGKTFAAGKEGKYFQEIYDTDFIAAWKSTTAPVLAIWGSSDFLSDGHDHEWIAAAVNSWRPGTAKYVKLEGVDHWLRKAESQKASMERNDLPYDDRLAQELLAFMRR